MTNNKQIEKLSSAWQGLIPKPVSLEKMDGCFCINQETKIVIASAEEEILKIGQYLANLLKPATGFPLEITKSTNYVAQNIISLSIKHDPSLKEEGYELVISTESINLSANKGHGLFNGIQTLRQLLPITIESNVKQDGPWELDALIVKDYPRFSWRGAMIDVARSFFTVEEVKRFIDLFALHKINRLHLHLSDDQGWRIEIKSWPELTSHGGKCAVEGGSSGYYTQDQYKEIVRYAHERFMLVIPEIDVPGHTNAALSSYAELNSDGIAPPYFRGMKVGFSTLDTDKDITYEFLTDVFTEIASITPGPYLHVGGDEALSTTEEEYSHFLSRLETIIASLGKTMIGWGEVGHYENLNSSAIIQLWQSPAKKDHEFALKHGIKTIMSPAHKIYVDMKYDESTHVGQDWAGYVSVETAYNWDPTSVYEGFNEQDILGIEAPLWTETIHNTVDADYMYFPRICGAAEIGWSPKDNRSWEEYCLRLARLGKRLEQLGVNFHRSPLIPWK